ncbi:hypothetical protein KAR91_10440 [Candidatus Pacearchaeota archaeon]|nr:hypothetical protein [Candidatus Pacearchaeota archaeon]
MGSCRCCGYPLALGAKAVVCSDCWKKPFVKHCQSMFDNLESANAELREVVGELVAVCEEVLPYLRPHNPLEPLGSAEILLEDTLDRLKPRAQKLVEEK